jgi:hypothetical protein
LKFDQARNRASVCSHSPMMQARCTRSVGQVFGKHVIRHVVGFNAERVLDDLGGAVAVVGADRLFEKVSTVSLSPGALIVSSPNPLPPRASRPALPGF